MNKIILFLLLTATVLLGSLNRDDAKNIVEDNATGLMWEDDENVSSLMNSTQWQKAIDYCETLVLGGYNDWRLPNINELYTIVDRGRNYPAFDPAFQYVAPSGSGYWSSTSLAANGTNAWLISSSGGIDYPDTKGWYGYIRCVRGGE